jgi:hypothetical protein
MYGLGAVGGALSVIGWGALNTCKFPYPTSAVELEVLMPFRYSDRSGRLPQPTCPLSQHSRKFSPRHIKFSRSLTISKDMAGAAGGGMIGREVIGGLFIIAYVLCTGSGILGVSIALNALSNHAACTVWWSFIATIVVIATASVRKFQKIGWL